ncbi:MAG: tRNA dimethylallyltransferase [Microgenomates group bacterium Gr01-1014_5]|nr:MAG: tRNA dimethylallyltransferase [Microgenomates group bacterium Gr01-1014_5]
MWPPSAQEKPSEEKLKDRDTSLYNLVMNKLLVICGPTATGKTSLALHLAEKFGGELVSADSRQVYRGMDVITGKGIPVNFKFKISNLKLGAEEIGYWTDSRLKIWLTDIVTPTAPFSVSQWRKEAKKTIDRLLQKDRLPIVVGGTGLYIESLIKKIESIDIPPNKKLRTEMEGKSAKELYETLASVDAIRAANMNQSDKKNPRRLLRAIEVGLSRERQSKRQSKEFNYLLIGLIAPRDVMFEKIKKGILKRLEEGALGEVEKLISQGVSWDAQSMTGIGYRELKPYFEKRENLEVCIKNWIKAEQRYARRQLTWFKKYKELKWFDVSRENWRQEVEILVQNWYN